MLYDKGLASPEQIKQLEESNDRWLESVINGARSTGCISSRLCKNCKHIISDSICMCIGHFICPNCSFENGKIEILPESEYKNSHSCLT